jgi:hypothetical protein
MLPRRSDRRRTDLGTKRAPLLSSAAGRLPFPRVNSFQAPSRNWCFNQRFGDFFILGRVAGIPCVISYSLPVFESRPEIYLPRHLFPTHDEH